MEIWKDIENYEGLYMVSNLGNVKSLARDVICKNGAIHHRKERILIPVDRGHGYLFIILCKNEKRKNVFVHRLVAQAFIDNPNNYTDINHKDEDKTNNCVSNLEYCDRRYNINYGTHNKRSAEARSKKVYQYSLDGVLIKEWESVNECGRNGFIRSAVSACCRNEFNKQGNNIYKGYIWKYN